MLYDIELSMTVQLVQVYLFNVDGRYNSAHKINFSVASENDFGVT